MLNQAKHIFIVGIKGVAMANLAVILTKMGKKVSGSDVADEYITDELLKKDNIVWSVGFDIKNLPNDVDLILYSASHQGSNNPQVQEGQKKGITVVSQAEFIGDLMKQFKTSIAVTGCHGKTTTSSLLAFALQNLGVKPSYMIGSSSFNDMPGGDYQGTDYFVVEADEYGVNPPLDTTPKFSYLAPGYILCTNIDFDHPDVYRNLEETQEAFFTFFGERKLILCADDKPTLECINRLKQDQYVTFGYSEKADLRIVQQQTSKDHSIFQIITGGKLKERQKLQFTINLFGEKNVSNAAGVILTLLQIGFPLEKIKEAIKDFAGAKRRFEKVFEQNGVKLYDDYAHHPQEIEATMKAARSRFPREKIIFIFQPHTYSRTQTLLKEFASSLALADISYVLPIFPSAREKAENFSVGSQDIAALKPDKIIPVASKNELLALLRTQIQPQTVIFTVGAGDVYKLRNDIINSIKSV